MADFFFSNIQTNYSSYNYFGEFYNRYKDISFENITIHLDTWFEANMCAVLGGLLDRLKPVNEISITSNDKRIVTILQKNGFLAGFGHNAIYDQNNTTIQYLKLKANENRFFSSYVNNELLTKSGFPTMTESLKRKISESIYEIFVNAQMHSNSEYIYTCGQFYPKKHKIEFTIVDMGQGFKANINNRFDRNLSSIQAIRWATENGRTTKIDAPGGIGLAILKEFITMNGGTFQIISYDGFYQIGKNEQELELKYAFPGTIVNMEFRTDDTCSYSLTSEADINNIF